VFCPPHQTSTASCRCFAIACRVAQPRVVTPPPACKPIGNSYPQSDALKWGIGKRNLAAVEAIFDRLEGRSIQCVDVKDVSADLRGRTDQELQFHLDHNRWPDEGELAPAPCESQPLLAYWRRRTLTARLLGLEYVCLRSGRAHISCQTCDITMRFAEEHNSLNSLPESLETALQWK